MSKPYILFLHGFPSLPTDFHNQLTHLSSLGYGVLAPELLGYGSTSHPDSSEAYRLKPMSDDMIDILNHHSIDNILAIGHDWGVTLLTRLEFYHPNRITKMAFLAIGPAPVGQPFDLDAVNKMTKENLGYEGFGYMDFFVRDPDAANIINSHQDSFRALTFSADASIWKTSLGPIDGLKQWLLDDRTTSTIAGYTELVRKEHETAFSNGGNAYSQTLYWYFNLVCGQNAADEQAELRARDLDVYRTSKPVLQILAGRDAIALPMIHQGMVEAYADSVRLRTLDTGHWVMLEAAGEVNLELETFFAG